jgi:Rrf2 family protein
LKKAKLVKAVKGASGGYTLAREAKQVKIYDIIKALEGEFNPSHCTGDKGKVYCSSHCNCEVTYVVSRVEQAISLTLKDIRLSQLI